MMTPNMHAAEQQHSVSQMVALVFKAAALGLSAISVLLAGLGIDVATIVVMLGIGLFALALSAMIEHPGV
jgi:hypothetical protein